MQSPPPVGDIKDIVVFGLLFVISAALANGMSVTPGLIWGGLRQHVQLSVFALIGNFVVVPALVFGFLDAFNFGHQYDIALALLALVAGAPFVAWMTSLGKGNILVAATMSFMLMVVTIVVMPLLLPWLLSGLNTGASPSRWLLYWPMLLFLAVPLAVGMLIRWRHPDFATQAASWLGPLSIAFLIIHIALMFATYWSDFTAEFGTGEIAFTFAFAIVCLLIGYILCPPYVLAVVKGPNPHYGTKLASAIGTAQKGSQMLICSLIFAFGRYPVAGVDALASSVVTILIVILYSLEMGRHHAAKLLAAAPVTPPATPVSPVAATPSATATAQP